MVTEEEIPQTKRSKRSRFASSSIPAIPAIQKTAAETATEPRAVSILRQRLSQKKESLTSTLPKHDSPSVNSTDAAPPPTKRRRTSRFAKATSKTEVAPSKVSTVDITSIPIAPVKTLRINRKVEKKQKLETVLKISHKDFLDTNPRSNPFFDPSLRKPPRLPRPIRKEFNFIDQGSISSRAQHDRQRAAIQARRDEFTSTVINTKSQLPVLPPLAEDLILPSNDEVVVPVSEWWDLPFVMMNKGVNDEEIELREGRVTHYIHHPTPIESVKQRGKSGPVLKLMLTKKEMKKLRRQRRMEVQKEQQEMIAAGLLAPLAPKVKISNMMRVLSTESSVDPTKMEAEVRAQVEARRLKHQGDNEARKKSGEEKHEKTRKKSENDRNSGLHACVFRVRNLSLAGHRFKISRNAKQLDISGTMVLFEGCNVVVVEGGAKALRKYKALMLRRIDWKEGEVGENECVLVWEGVVSSGSFKSFGTAKMDDEASCRHLFSSHRVEHYWDLCLQGSPTGNEQLGVRHVR